jgi:hypothetical protein
MAVSYLSCNLLGTPLDAKVKVHIGPDFGIYTTGITAELDSFRRLAAGLFGAITTLSTPAGKFAIDCYAVSVQ